MRTRSSIDPDPVWTVTVSALSFLDMFFLIMEHVLTEPILTTILVVSPAATHFGKEVLVRNKTEVAPKGRLGINGRRLMNKYYAINCSPQHCTRSRKSKGIYPLGVALYRVFPCPTVKAVLRGDFGQRAVASELVDMPT